MKYLVLSLVLLAGNFGFSQTNPFYILSRDTSYEGVVFDSYTGNYSTGTVYDKIWGVANQYGKLVVPYNYSYIDEFSEGLAFAVVFLKRDSVIPSYKCVYIDTTGKIVIPLDQAYCSYESYDFNPVSRQFSNGMVLIKDQNNMIGYMDKTGKVIIKCNYNRAGPFSEGLAFAAQLVSYSGGEEGSGSKENSGITVGYIDKKGNWVIKLSDPNLHFKNNCYLHGGPFKNGEAKMSMAEFGCDCNEYKWIRIDKKGKILAEGDNWEDNQ
jgi:hypothetical protein